MPGRRRLKAVFYLNLLLVALLVGYKIYLNFFERDFESVHPVQVELIQSRLEGRERFRFAVVGNINNSIGIFERKIVPMLNAAAVDFVISAGNAVSGGGEDKYRALEGALERLDMPYLLTFGPHEAENFGQYRFYEHFGPFFFAFSAGNSRYIFLDTTGTTSFAWQLRWLEEQLAAAAEDHIFVFMSHPIRHVPRNELLAPDEDYLVAPAFRAALVELASQHDVDAVFSANLPFFEHQRRGGVDYYVTGGAGGLVLNDENSFYHFLEIIVDGRETRVVLNRLDIGQHQVFKTLESLWLFVHSLFYVGYVNFLLIVSALILLAIKLYTLIFVERDYYPRYDIDPSPWLKRPLRVAAFTNNYLPFVGGVPISIDRLRRGLESLGGKVLVIAPCYGRRQDAAENVLRVPALLSFGERGEFRMANIFKWNVRQAVRRFRPDIIHVHHPVWLGSLGVYMARRLRVPVVFTYHTRLEHYAHFVPLPGPLFRNLISHWLIRRFANKCDAVIVPTYSAEEYLRVIGVTSDIFVQPTGIDFERFRDIDPAAVEVLRRELRLADERVLVSLSRLSKEKNIDFLLDAAAELRRRKLRFRLLILGDGNERERLEQRIRDEGLNDNVTLAGGVPPERVPAWLALGDVFVFASKSETQGMVILEAMAAGLPVVAVRSSGIDDVVRDGANGFKTPDSVPLWCERVEQLLTDDRLRDRLAANAREFAAGFSIREFARGVNRVYAHTLAVRAVERRRRQTRPADPR